jgi:hypothetical protein
MLPKLTRNTAVLLWSAVSCWRRDEVLMPIEKSISKNNVKHITGFDAYSIIKPAGFVKYFFQRLWQTPIKQ